MKRQIIPGVFLYNEGGLLVRKVIVVEGRSDLLRLKPLFAEPVEIICTHGTISPYHLELLLEPYEDDELYVFLDADEAGEKTRALFTREFPEARHLYTEELYREVETTPLDVLVAILQVAHFNVKDDFNG